MNTAPPLTQDQRCMIWAKRHFDALLRAKAPQAQLQAAWQALWVTVREKKS